MYKCENCGYTTDELTLEIEYIPYGDEMARHESCSYDCGRCGGELIPAVSCHECSEDFLKEEMVGQLCKECFEDYKALKYMKQYISERGLTQEYLSYNRDPLIEDEELILQFVMEEPEDFADWICGKE